MKCGKSIKVFPVSTAFFFTSELKHMINVHGRLVVLLLLNFLFNSCIKAQKKPINSNVPFEIPLNYIVYQTTESMTIDGNASEPAWQKAAWSEDFGDIEGSVKPKPTYRTRFKALWNEHYLYLFAELEEPHIWAKLTEHDQIVYHDNDFEIFIDPDGDSQLYFEIEVNAYHTIFDLFLDKPYRNGGKPLITWNAEELKTGLDIDGTINDPSDIDKKWSIEMAIPFKSLSFGNSIQIPADGDTWRANFSRVEWDMEIINNEYIKKIDPKTKKPFSEHNWVWSPQGIINMHFPERWGYFLFSTSDVGSESIEFQLPECESIKRTLWSIYYVQSNFYKNEGRYAKNLNELPSDNSFSIDQNAISMESTTHQYLAIIQCKESKEFWCIDQNGLLKKITAYKNQ